VLTDDYPEESIVRGLALLAAWPPAKILASAVQPLPADDARSEAALPTPRSVNPRAVFAFELFGGLVGFLGLGWMFMLGNIPVGCLALASWWAVLAIVIISAGGLAVWQERWWMILLWVPVWIGVPLLSAWVARRQVLTRNRHLVSVSHHTRDD
jgi:hypothetical protein